MQFLEKICSLKMSMLEKEKDLEINDSSIHLKKLKRIAQSSLEYSSHSFLSDDSLLNFNYKLNPINCK